MSPARPLGTGVQKLLPSLTLFHGMVWKKTKLFQPDAAVPSVSSTQSCTAPMKSANKYSLGEMNPLCGIARGYSGNGPFCYCLFQIETDHPSIGIHTWREICSRYTVLSWYCLSTHTWGYSLMSHCQHRLPPAFAYLPSPRFLIHPLFSNLCVLKLSNVNFS